MSTKTSMAEQDLKSGVGAFRGHPTIYVDGAWLYQDNMQPIPGWGGEARPCAKCGSAKWSGDGEPDECLGLLPGVTNACCGHGCSDRSYMVFESGLVIRGFVVESQEAE